MPKNIRDSNRWHFSSKRLNDRITATRSSSTMICSSGNGSLASTSAVASDGVGCLSCFLNMSIHCLRVTVASQPGKASGSLMVPMWVVSLRKTD